MRDHSESATDYCNAPDRRVSLSLGGAFIEMFKSFNIISATTVFIWVLITASAVSLPFLPTDGTRYVSVAWDMWLNHSQWVPLMNGAPYSDKPPLLFWLMELGWYVFGVNDIWPRLISPLASLLALTQLYRIARGLGYSTPIAQLSQLVLLSLPLWSLYSSLVMFDVLLSACVLGAIEPLTRPGTFTFRRALISGIWLGMAMLTKGPVGLMAFVPLLVTAGVWRREPLGRRDIVGGILAILMSIAILMTWALSAAWAGGHEFAQSLLWGQTVDRMHGDNAAHARPLWWYCSWLPIFAAPWVLWAEQWVRLNRSSCKSLLFWWLLPPFLVFSLISGKQVHYMMPLMPALGWSGWENKWP
ncbi:ArnT family glycosyltransferase [Carnimonas nigrificans]|uniref:ArnT family glycosyltransferase n=1 Tax=Carnimonas nigrificans TaxID=64323 RepID=UPI0004B98BC6|nr:glycosyltransferase family 39 protein [Carnimonas nigrificans]